MTGHRAFDELVAEAEAQPVEGWDFSWLAGRATEERPSWGYSGLLRERLAGARAVLDIQTGGGTYLSQQIGPGTNRELTDFMMGPQPVNQARSPQRAETAARAAGLVVTELRERAMRVEFFDVGAVVYFLRKVLWTVPGFTVAGYADQLARMHEHITEHGSFISHARRFLIAARAPDNPARSECR